MMNKLPITLKRIGKAIYKSPTESAVIALLILAIGYVAVPAQAAYAAQKAVNIKTNNLVIEAMQNQTSNHGKLPESGFARPDKVIVMEVSAYNSLPEQTDSTPFITASNTQTRWGVVATNQLPFGTKIKIPSVYGDQIFVVEDRMNTRYKNNVDIWMEKVSDARKFGRRSLEIEVYYE